MSWAGALRASICVFKMLFFRPKELLDVEKVVALQGATLDRSYVRSWLVDMVGEEDARITRWDALVATYPS
jgi:hypothetical protein